MIIARQSKMELAGGPRLRGEQTIWFQRAMAVEKEQLRERRRREVLAVMNMMPLHLEKPIPCLTRYHLSIIAGRVPDMVTEKTR